MKNSILLKLATIIPNTSNNPVPPDIVQMSPDQFSDLSSRHQVPTNEHTQHYRNTRETPIRQASPGIHAINTTYKDLDTFNNELLKAQEYTYRAGAGSVDATNTFNPYVNYQNYTNTVPWVMRDNNSFLTNKLGIATYPMTNYYKPYGSPINSQRANLFSREASSPGLVDTNKNVIPHISFQSTPLIINSKNTKRTGLSEQDNQILPSEIFNHELDHSLENFGSVSRILRPYSNNFFDIKRNEERKRRFYQSPSYVDYYSFASPSENFPAATALQRHMFQTTGSRFETPEQYNEWLQQFDNLPNDSQFEQSLAPLPIDVRRYLRNRRNYIKDSNNRNNFDHRVYDRNFSRLIPALVNNNRNTNKLNLSNRLYNS